MFSRYERVTDRRTFKDRRDLWAVPKETKDFVAEKPKAKIKNVDVPKNDDLKRKQKKSNAEEEHHEEVEEQHEEEHNQEEHQEEEHQEEPAEEEAEE